MSMEIEADSNPTDRKLEGPTEYRAKFLSLPRREGKWSVQEEQYANRLIEDFVEGVLDLPDGTSLRTYLASILNCSTMRVSKKYVGEASLGRKFFKRPAVMLPDYEREERKKALADLEYKFHYTYVTKYDAGLCDPPSEPRNQRPRSNPQHSSPSLPPTSGFHHPHGCPGCVSGDCQKYAMLSPFAPPPLQLSSPFGPPNPAHYPPMGWHPAPVPTPHGFYYHYPPSVPPPHPFYHGHSRFHHHPPPAYPAHPPVCGARPYYDPNQPLAASVELRRPDAGHRYHHSDGSVELRGPPSAQHHRYFHSDGTPVTHAIPPVPASVPPSVPAPAPAPVLKKEDTAVPHDGDLFIKSLESLSPFSEMYVRSQLG